MLSNQIIRASLSAGLSVVLVACAACSSSPRVAQSEGSAVAQSAPAGAAEAPDLTATEAAAEGGAAAEPSGASPAGDSSGIINPTAPQSYTVKRGDTLWDISSLFLRDPWLWPEIWTINPQVPNPHLIYPGDVLSLAYGTDGRPQIRLERGGAARLNPRLRSSPLDGAIPTIPYSAIAAFLSRPSVLSADDVRKAPHVLAFREGHMVGGTGIEIYVRDLEAPRDARYSVVHVGDPLRDPDDGDIVGYQGIYTATALVTQPGKVTKAMLTDSARETFQGDRLFANNSDTPLNIMPRAPEKEIEGRIMSVVDGVQLIGQYQIVVINRGQRHGIDAGHVLAVDQAGEVVRDRYTSRMNKIQFGSAFAPRVRLPNERAGTLLVFKSFDRISYALVVGASSPMRVGDIVGNP